MKTKLKILLMLIVAACISSIVFNIMLGNNDYSSESLNAVFGSSRKALSDYFYDKADIYFHRGITDHGHNGCLADKIKDHNHGQNHHEMADHDHHHDDHADVHDHEHHESVFAFHTPIETFYQEMAYATIPHGHFHRTGEESKEILPWVYLAVKTNPQNDELYRTIAYWLQQSFGREDLSMQILNEAQQNIAYSPSIKLEQGMLLLEQDKKNKALQKFQAALRFMNRLPETEQEPYLKANILLEIAVIQEENGNYQKALNAYEQIYNMFPERIHTGEKIKELKKKLNT